REAMLLDVLLDGVRDVGEAPAGPALLDAELEALPGDVEQLLDPRRHLTDRQRERAIGVVPIHDTPQVQTDDVALLDPPLRGRNAVHDFLVDRDAHGGREAAIAL